MTTAKFRSAVEVASASNLITAELDALLRELLELGVDWTPNILSSVQTTVARLKDELSKNSYNQYLRTGVRPSAIRRRDWNAKERYYRLTESIEKYVGIEQKVAALSTKATSGLDAALEAVDLEHDLYATAVSSKREQAELSAEDYDLCAAWAGALPSQGGLACLADLVGQLGEFEAGRLSSARAAELSVAQYYRDLNFAVEDVSITQLRGGQDWLEFDLLVDGSPVDVKNARRSFSSPNMYVEHAVPAFKLARSGKQVSVAGVLSDYRPHLSEDLRLVYQAQVLGEVRLPHLRGLFEWMRRRFGDILNLDHMWKPEYQPGWVFEYRPEHYPARAAALQRIPDFLERIKGAGFKPQALAGWLSTLHPNPQSLDLSAEQRSVAADVHDLSTNVGLSRPSLYLYAMGTLVKSIQEHTATGRAEETLRRALFGLVDLTYSTRPLGLEDPQGYVRGIIEALSEVKRAVLASTLRFTAFRLTHPEILRGCTTDGSWLTLLAYCGGWRQEPMRVKCGSSPLIFGPNKPCPTCGYLACNDCGYCSHECARGAERQQRVAAAVRARTQDYRLRP